MGSGCLFPHIKYVFFLDRLLVCYQKKLWNREKDGSCFTHGSGVGVCCLHLHMKLVVML